MKLPWDQNYLKISLHVIFTGILIYVFYFVATNFNSIYSSITSTINWIISLLAPLIVGIIIAYLLDPAADFFQNKYNKYKEKKPFKPFFNKKAKKAEVYDYNEKKKDESSDRKFGAIITYLIIFAIISIIVLFCVNWINSGLSNIGFLIDELNSYTHNFNELLNNFQVMLDDLGILEYFKASISTGIDIFTKFIEDITGWLVSLIGSAGSLLLNALVSLVIGFYLLKEKQRALDKCNSILSLFISPRRYIKVKNVFSDMNAILSGYIRGQLLDASIMAVLISVALTICGINFSVIIGILSGFSNLIPYFGAFVGFFLAVVVGLLSGTPLNALYAGITIIVLQQIDGMFIVPKIVGEKISLHPAVVLLTITAAGYAFGIVGMIVAVPIVAIVKMFIDRYLMRKQMEKIAEAEAVSNDQESEI